MRILVDEMPYWQERCPYAEWIPCIDPYGRDGYFRCKFDDEKCDLFDHDGDDGCRWLVKAGDSHRA